MKKIVVLKHQNEMKYSKDFFQMEIPKELSRLVYVIVSICLISLLVIIFGRVDDVIKTHGIVKTKENVSSVNNIISGRIVELNYEPGRKVCKDDVLYKIDSSVYDAQRKMIEYENADLENKIKGLDILQKSYDNNINMCDINDTLSYSRFNAYLENKSVLEIKTKIAENEYLFEKQKPKSLKNSYNIEMKLQDYNLALAELNSFKTSFIANINSEKNDKQIVLFKNNQNLLKLDNEYSFLSIKAPMSGYVQEIASLNVGDYLEANSKVLNIIPNDNANFRVEIQIPSKDIGKIKIGQKVKYRLSAFPYFEYKGAEGVITSIDPDIRTNEKGTNPYYSAYADIDRISFSNKHGECFPIRVGLETDVRIVLDRRPIIYFILKKLDFIN